VVLAAIFAIVLLIFAHGGGRSKSWYWASIVTARTAGTTLGDLVANQHVLHLGLPLSTACTCSLLAGTVLLRRDKSSVAVREV